MLTDYLTMMVSATAMGLLAISLMIVVGLALWQATGWAITQLVSPPQDTSRKS
jgi:hypothetical protein